MTVAKSLFLSASYLQSREEATESQWMSPGDAISSTSFLASHLERCYFQQLEQMPGGAARYEGLSEPEAAPCDHHEGRHERELPSCEAASTASKADDDCTELEAEAVLALADRLPGILQRAGCTSVDARLWGVNLGEDTAGERASLLAAFLRAREWSVDAADDFLASTLKWRREKGIDARGMLTFDAHAGPAGQFPDDAVRTIESTLSDGSPRTFVVLAMGRVTFEGLQRVEEVRG